MFQFTSAANVNSLYWITSLEPENQGTTRRVIEDLEPFFSQIGLPFNFFEPKTAAELRAFLRDLATAAKTGTKPIIHIDTHGADDQGILISASKEFVSWADLHSLLRAINVATGNNLCVVSAACYGMRLIKEISITEPCPFFLMVAPEKAVSFGFVEQATVAFYKDVFENSNILAAYEKHLKDGLSVFHSEKMFAIVLARYFKFKCVGRGGRERRERLLSQVIESGIPNNRRNRRVIRSTTKAMTRPTAEVVNKYGRTFLIGKKIPFGFVELMKLINGTKTVD